jgi:hypothetical protein
MQEDGEWKKSSLSFANGNCVEFRALANGDVQLRNSKKPKKFLTFTPGEWDAFVGGVSNGEFDRFGHG